MRLIRGICFLKHRNYTTQFNKWAVAISSCLIVASCASNGTSAQRKAIQQEIVGYWIGHPEGVDTRSVISFSVIAIRQRGDTISFTADGTNWQAFSLDSTRIDKIQEGPLKGDTTYMNATVQWHDKRSFASEEPKSISYDRLRRMLYISFGPKEKRLLLFKFCCERLGTELFQDQAAYAELLPAIRQCESDNFSNPFSEDPNYSSPTPDQIIEKKVEKCYGNLWDKFYRYHKAAYQAANEEYDAKLTARGANVYVPPRERPSGPPPEYIKAACREETGSNNIAYVHCLNVQWNFRQ